MMKFFARMVGYLATTMALCAVLFSFAATWFGEKGSVLQFAREMMFERRRSQALRHYTEVSNHSLETKTRITADLVGGRLRLREAIVQFQRVTRELIENLASEDVDRGMAAYVPPPTDPESVGCQILEWVRVRVREDVATWPPDKAELLLADFEREFRELFGRASLSDSSTDTELTRPDVSASSAAFRRRFAATKY